MRIIHWTLTLSLGALLLGAAPETSTAEDGLKRVPGRAVSPDVVKPQRAQTRGTKCPAGWKLIPGSVEGGRFMCGPIAPAKGKCPAKHQWVERKNNDGTVCAVGCEPLIY